jgi:hypothetical protein
MPRLSSITSRNLAGIGLAIVRAFNTITRRGSIQNMGEIGSSNNSSACLISPYVMMTTASGTGGGTTAGPRVIATSFDPLTYTGTVGAPTAIGATSGFSFGSCQLSSGVAFTTWSQNGTGFCAVITNGGSGTVLTKNAEAIFNSTTFTTTAHCVALSSTLVLITYITNADNFQRIVAVSISGTTCTVGTPVQLNSVNSSGSLSAIAALTSTTAVVAFNNAFGTQSLSVVTVSGTTISLGTTFTPGQDPANVFRIVGLCAVDSTSFIMVYTTAALIVSFPTGGGGSTRVRRLNVSGTTISEGASSPDIVLVTSTGSVTKPIEVARFTDGGVQRFVFHSNYAIEDAGNQINVNNSWFTGAWVISASTISGPEIVSTLAVAANAPVGFLTTARSGSSDNGWQWISLVQLSNTEYVWHSGYTGNAVSPSSSILFRSYTLS